MSQKDIFVAVWQRRVLLPSERWRSSHPDHDMSLVPRCLRKRQEKGMWHRNVGSLTERQNSPICLFKVVFLYCLRERRLLPESLRTAYTLRRLTQDNSFPQQRQPQRPLLPCTAYGAGSQGFAPGFLFLFFILFIGPGSWFLVFLLLPVFVSGTLCWQLPQQPALTTAGGEAAGAQCTAADRQPSSSVLSQSVLMQSITLCAAGAGHLGSELAVCFQSCNSQILPSLCAAWVGVVSIPWPLFVYFHRNKVNCSFNSFEVLWTILELAGFLKDWLVVGGSWCHAHLLHLLCYI